MGVASWIEHGSCDENNGARNACFAMAPAYVAPTWRSYSLRPMVPLMAVRWAAAREWPELATTHVLPEQ